MKEEEDQEKNQPLPDSDGEDDVLPLPAVIVSQFNGVPLIASPPPTLTEALSNSRTNTPISAKSTPVNRVYQQTTPTVRAISISPLKSSLKVEQLSATPDTDDESPLLAQFGKLLPPAPLPPLIAEPDVHSIELGPLASENDSQSSSESSEEEESEDSSSEEDQNYERGHVLYDFSGQNEREMNVNAGQIVYILKRDNTQWWLIQNFDGSFGYVPSNFIKVIDS